MCWAHTYSYVRALLQRVRKLCPRFDFIHLYIFHSNVALFWSAKPILTRAFVHLYSACASCARDLKSYTNIFFILTLSDKSVTRLSDKAKWWSGMQFVCQCRRKLQVFRFVHEALGWGECVSSSHDSFSLSFSSPFHSSGFKTSSKNQSGSNILFSHVWGERKNVRNYVCHKICGYCSSWCKIGDELYSLFQNGVTLGVDRDASTGKLLVFEFIRRWDRLFTCRYVPLARCFAAICAWGSSLLFRLLNVVPPQVRFDQLFCCK